MLKLHSFTAISLAFMVLTSQGSIAQSSIEYHYQSNGLLSYEDGPRDDVQDIVEYQYTGAGYLSSVVNALGHTALYLDHNNHGQAQRVVSANNTITDITYSVQGWPTRVVLRSPDGFGEAAVSEYSYNAVGLLISTRLPNGQIVSYGYDTARRLTTIVYANGDKLLRDLDNAGNVVRESIVGSNDVERKTLAYVYDELSRVRSVIGAHDQRNSLQYDVNSNVLDGVDGNNNSTQNQYDALDRIIETLDPLLGETKYSYDTDDNVQAVTDTRGLTTHYSYNEQGLLTRLNSPDTGITDYTYDKAGNRVSVIDSRGIIAEYTYDVLSRLSTVNYPNRPEENIEYHYDNSDDGNFGVGLLTSRKDSSGETYFRYNHAGQLIQRSYSIAGQNYSIQYSYNNAQQLQSLRYPSGRIVNYSYDEYAQLIELTTRETATSDAVRVVDAISYVPLGGPASWSYGNDLQQQLQYDLDYRLSQVSTSSLADSNYFYDNNNNINAINNEALPDKNKSYRYDELNRLIQAEQGDESYQYAYDAVGNRKSLTFQQGDNLQQEDYQYASDSNRLLSVTGDQSRGFSYDQNGNVISDGANSTDLEYNDQNRPVSASIASQAISYRYNSRGLRTLKQTASGTLHYHYDEAGLLLAESYDNGSIVREYIYLGAQVIALLVDNDANSDNFELSITQPINNVVVQNSNSITFSAELEAAYLSEIANIVWSSNLDGDFGQGGSLDVSNLSLGMHVVSARLSSADGHIGFASVVVTVIAPEAIVDVDNDGMDDLWEAIYFTSLTQNATSDYDGDGISDLHEYQLGSDPLDSNPDIDGDGLPDIWENQYFSSLTNGAADDTDNDGLSNEVELNLETDPADGNPDFDEDQLRDSWEFQHFGDLSAQANDNADDDFFTNVQELSYGLSPVVANVLEDAYSGIDTDNDSLVDVWEIFYFDDLSQNTEGDPDGDSFSNFLEHMHITNPNDASSGGSLVDDTDNDGLLDRWELQYFLNLNALPGEDFDGDGFNNAEEYRRGFDPNVNDIKRLAPILMLLNS